MEHRKQGQTKRPTKTDKQTNRQTDIQIDRQIQTEKQTKMFFSLHLDSSAVLLNEDSNGT
jgi:hypothetical protein